MSPGQKLTPEVAASLRLLLRKTVGLGPEYTDGQVWLAGFLKQIEDGETLAAPVLLGPTMNRALMGNLVILGVLNAIEPDREHYKPLKGSNAVRLAVSTLDGIGGYGVGLHAREDGKFFDIALTRPA